MKAPTRFLDDPTLQAGLRSDLQQYAREAARYDAAKGAASLAGALAALDAAPAAASEPSSFASGAGAASGATGSWPIVIKALMMIVGGGALGTGAYQVVQRETAPLSAPRASPAAHGRDPKAAAPSPAPAAALPAPGAAEVVPPPAAGALPESTNPQRRDSASRREIAQLLKIRELLAREPAAAHRLAEASQREFPAGALREEREGLAVVALFEMGETSRAQLEAARFLARYPQSPLRERIRRLSESSAP